MSLPRPQGQQKQVVCLDHEGHAVVLGTAGSGKTTMAIHRAVYLSNPATEHGGRTLLVTFNNALVTYLNYLRPPEMSAVDVRTYHRFARGYLDSRGLMHAQSIVNGQTRSRLITEAVDRLRARHPEAALLARPIEFHASEIQWINQHGMVDEAQYVQAERVGRARANLSRAQRPLMFELYQTYREIRQTEGWEYDWEDLPLAALQELDRDGENPMYRHIVIDEGQDFSPVMLRSLARAIPQSGSLTVFADVAQQIYGRRISWQDAGLIIDTPWFFRKNYRNSPQIAALGLAIAEMPYYADEPDMVAPDEFAAEGPKPTLVCCSSEAVETQLVIEQALAAAESGSVAVLTRRGSYAARLGRAFHGAQHLHKDMGAWRPGPGVSYGTIHAGKGLEFDTVILPRLSTDHLPDPRVVEVEGEADAAAGDGRLLYVGVTRARQSLIMTYSGQLTALMPPHPDLWQEATR